MKTRQKIIAGTILAAAAVSTIAPAASATEVVNHDITLTQSSNLNANNGNTSLDTTPISNNTNNNEIIKKIKELIRLIGQHAWNDLIDAAKKGWEHFKEY